LKFNRWDIKVGLILINNAKFGQIDEEETNKGGDEEFKTLNGG